MIWVMHKKRMGLITELACLSLLLLMILQLETPCLAAGSTGRLNRFKGGSGFQVNPVKPHGGITGNAEKDADEIFGADKRKVYTGPNPLHNR
ncbi:hypothetical protein I3843_10G041600 [Carya illinoinensis]|uniref:Uncharacterized protein n=1 Tax=Carya illinoinensis TaxID=32201 RepID=A0A8T1P8N3_CARIL|nr:hypothetical protein I3760_10G041300 [Carya illinoinensis]KAG6638538.1 hypothetical protein CIPAW_10G041900 [Carya illinoinensis]KAG7958877.1 hypothetical protein I3843_10G041600 [Carya illinoinensis]